MNVPNQRARYLTLAAAFLGWMFDGMEMGIFPLVASPALEAMGQARGLAAGGELLGFKQYWMGVVTAAFLIGAAAGGLVFGWLGDRIGRVRAMTASILGYSLFTGLCYFAQEPWHLAVLRFLAALGMGGEWSLGVALVMEIWPSEKRPLMAAFIGAAANIGYMLIALIGILAPIKEDSWRWVMIVGATPAALTFLIRLFVPESEKWKESVKAHGKAQPVREIFAQGLMKNTLLAISFASVALIVTWGIVQWIPLWADEMTGKRVPAIKAWSQFWQSTGAALGCVLAALLGGALGRRPTYFLLCVSSLVVCQWLFRGFDGATHLFFFAVFLTGVCTASFYGWLPLYLPEIFPTRVRATGQGLAFNFGRILAALGAWQMPALMAFFERSYPKAGATIAFVYVIGMVLIWFAPETKNRPLPE
jgi:MFS transporter, SHS family, sialic acid transporter